MKLREEIFSIKLCELEQNYGQLCSRLRLCQREEHGEICRELQKIAAECRENALLLKESVAAGRSPAIAALAEAQLAYCQKAETIRREQLPGYLHSEGSGSLEDQAEASTLYAEYAIDFATQAMRHALLAALSAIDAQMSCEEEEHHE